MSEPTTSRARGRARARARGSTTDAPRRPGMQEPERPTTAPATQPTPMAAAGGRRAHRGVPRSDTAERVEAISEAMSGMSVSGEFAGRGRLRDEFSNDNTRPPHVQDKRGTSGAPIDIVANYFELLSRPQWCVYQYHCDFAPVVESSRMRSAFIREHKEAIGQAYIFDGMSDLKALKKLDEVTELYSKRQTDQETIRITLKRVAELAPNHPELGRLYNTQMRRNLRHLKYQLLGRHYFDVEAISEVPKYRLQIWQGVITSIRQQEEKLMMSIDTVHKVVRKETALEIIQGFVRGAAGADFREKATQELVGVIVMTRYNNRTYRIEDIDWSQNPSKTFDSRDGPLTYMDYYKKQYDINIRDTKQPLLLCTSKEKEIRQGASQSKKIYLIPELCLMTGITDKMRSDFTMMRELGNETRLNPNQRVRNLETFIQRVNRNESVAKEMRDWGLKFSDTLVNFKGRVLPPETIIQGSKKSDYKQSSGDFSKEVRGLPLHAPMNLENWLVICTSYDEGKCNDFLQTMERVCKPMGMRVRSPNVVVIQGDRVNNYLQAFRDNYNPRTEMVVFIVPNDRKERYDALKKHTCLDNAVPSQVIVSRTLSKKQMLMSVATKIAIQINCKLGGEPWAVDIPFKLKVMIIGYDTYHDSSRKGRSAGAFVASMNQLMTRWFSKVSFHSAGGWEELSNHLRVNLSEALRKYKELNGCVPDRIIFYRDGVGDGQIRYVKEWEIKQFVSVINDMLGDKGTRYAFIIVNKKVNARFFHKTQNGYLNPPPGTLIDNTVTRYDRYDFYLVSQSVKQGTVAPTMYNVIEDNSGLKPEHLQRLSYKLTHLYYNWPGTIRVPAPCQYAHKLAFLTGQSLHQPPKAELSETLFYL